jgi:hypothetical protein
VTDREKWLKLIEAGWVPYAWRQNDDAGYHMSAAWSEYERQREASKYPKWSIVSGKEVLRMDSVTDGVLFAHAPRLIRSASGWVGRTICSRDIAVARLAEILRDPTVAAYGYRANVFWRPAKDNWLWQVWNKEADSADIHGYAPTEPAAREALAAWLLDNTMKETKQ